MSPFFSIIIPVYNVAPYLRECLDSVLAQTFTDWEAICVDDGSTDGSGAILDEYAAKDKRIRVIHQPNAGVSAARNKALGVVDGEWLLFLDGDDVLRADGLEIFLPYIKTGKYDGILVHPYIPWWSGGEIPDRQIQTHALVDGASIDDLIFGPYAANGFTVSRVYKRSVFGHLRFPVGIKMAEDVYFWFDALCIPAKWMILNAEYYLYRQHQDSVCGQKSPKDCEAVLDSVLYACNRISDGMGLGVCGARRYLERWPFSPAEYLRIFVARFRELNSASQNIVFLKARQIENVFGGWPFSLRLRCELWLIEHRMVALLPVIRLFCSIGRLSARCIRLLRYAYKDGFGFAVGKVKRQILHQGEYARRLDK